jgi:hypothetical protein
MNPNNFINVHEYDSKLKNIFKPNRKYSIEEKEKLFGNLLVEFRNLDAIQTIQIMIIDMYKPNGGDNYHPENDLDSTDILADILSRDYKDLLPLIEEQLSDTKQLGVCNSGRCCRLIQIWSCLN